MSDIINAEQSSVAAARSLIHHRWFEDVIAILIGSNLVAFGILFLNQTGMITGGTAGLSLFLHYTFGMKFGTIFFLINLPFYYLAIRRMGWEFTIKTFAAIALVSLLSNIQPYFIHIDHLQPVYAALFGGCLFGTGFIVLFRHQASLGGFNILALFIQSRTGIRAGWLLMACDVVIMLVSLSVINTYALILSIICALILNLIIALNHRQDRYTV
ncbi:YitT family protein [Vibrio zhugei]|uniref:YitT family protein n=1 Tax=Vibrio zhugei TaxID=2479546 RepID=A0ABV7CDC7_9VIBR|nr:YitT family protein [Vibrio zhugei]